MTADITGAVVLVLAPHTDDGELGAGASIAKWCRTGNSLHYTAFSACETIQPPGQENILRRECPEASSKLGVPSSNIEILDFEVRHFDRERQRILDNMVRLNQELSPDLVLLPSTDDTHQDHHIVSQEARRAFKRTRMLGYEVPWNNFRFDTTAFVRVEESDLDRKVDALSKFKSQASRNYMNREYQESQLRFRGVQAGCAFAEAFQVLRWYL